MHGITYGAGAVRVSKAAWVPPELLVSGDKVARGDAQGCKVTGTLVVKKVWGRGRSGPMRPAVVLSMLHVAAPGRWRAISTLQRGGLCERRASTCTRSAWMMCVRSMRATS